MAVTLLSLISPAHSEPGPTQNDYHCKNQASWQEWHALLEKHPNDDSVYTLYALRLGLCSMVEAGNIDKDRAVKIFEGMRGTVIQQYKDYDSAEGNRKGKI